MPPPRGLPAGPRGRSRTRLSDSSPLYSSDSAHSREGCALACASVHAAECTRWPKVETDASAAEHRPTESSDASNSAASAATPGSRRQGGRTISSGHEREPRRESPRESPRDPSPAPKHCPKMRTPTIQINHKNSQFKKIDEKKKSKSHTILSKIRQISSKK